jgi:hypothetical protein
MNNLLPSTTSLNINSQSKILPTQEAKTNSILDIIDDKNKEIIEEYEEEWAYEDESESNSSEFIEDEKDNYDINEGLNDFTTLVPDIPSSVEAVIERIEDSRFENQNQKIIV